MSYCEHCEREYEGELCPACGAVMLQEVDPERMEPDPGGWSFSFRDGDQPPWPLRPDGEPYPPARLMNCADLMSEEDILISRLRADGIPVQVRYPKAGALGKVYWGFSGTGADLYVPENLLEEARALLRPAMEATGDAPDEEEEIE